jgi:hypothetical protein
VIAALSKNEIIAKVEMLIFNSDNRQLSRAFNV